MGKNLGKNTSKNLSAKYSQTLFSHAKQSATDARKHLYNFAISHISLTNTKSLTNEKIT